MGNCQAAEAATVVIQHPGSKVEKKYWSVSANEVMHSNPGHYVALVVTSPTAKSENGTPLKQLKLLRPNDTLLIGQVYRLVSFEELLKEFARKKSVKLGKLLKERGEWHNNLQKKRDMATAAAQMEQEIYQVGGSGGGSSSTSSTSIPRVGRHHGGGQWKPALQSIAELESNLLSTHPKFLPREKEPKSDQDLPKIKR